MTSVKQYKQAVCSFIINNKGLILSCARKEDSSIFGLPGGKVDYGDIDLERAASRELFEETSLLGIGGIPIYTGMCYGSDGNHYLTTTFIWNCLTGNVARKDNEGLVAWTSTDVICRLNTGKYKNFGIYNRALFKHMNIFVPGITEAMQDVICVEYKGNRIEEVK